MKSPKTAKLPESPDVSSNASWLERHFHISKRGSSIGQEVRGGLVTFFAMAYIIALNPLIIGTAANSCANERNLSDTSANFGSKTSSRASRSIKA